MTVTKADMIKLLADSTGLTKTDVEAVVSGFLYNVIDSIQNGDRVEIRGFGSFYAKEREARDVKKSTNTTSGCCGSSVCAGFSPGETFP